jgi:hypothetical protein
MSDTFQRLESSGWGVSDSGFAWQGTDGGVSPGFAYLTASSASTTAQLDVPGRDPDPVDMLVQGKISGQTPNKLSIGLAADWVALTDFSTWDHAPQGLDLSKPWNLLVHREAGLIAAKIWQSGQAEPPDWQLTASSDVNPVGGFLAAFNYGQAGGATRLTVTSVEISGPGACAPPPTGKSTSCTITDTFQRSQSYEWARGWGTSDGGFPWLGDAWAQVTPGSASIEQSGGSEGVYAWEFLATPQYDKAPFDLTINGDFSGPFLDVYNGTEFGQVSIDVAGAPLNLYHWAPGGDDHINEVPIDVDLGQPWTLQVHREPGVVQFKIWQAGQTAPSEWQQLEWGQDANSDPWMGDFYARDSSGRGSMVPSAVAFYQDPGDDSVLNVHYLQITGTVSGSNSCAPNSTNKLTVWGQGKSAYTSQSIVTSGPLTNIQIGNDLNCAVNYLGDTHGEFLDDTACGTFVSVDGQLFGPSNVPGNYTQRSAYTPISQSLQHSGDTWAIATQVGLGTTGVSLYESDQYTAGDNHYDTSFSVMVDGGQQHRVVVFHAADCYIADDGDGYGYQPPDGIGVGCQALNDTSRTAVFSGKSYPQYWQWMEGTAPEVWQQISTGQPFPNTVRSQPSDVHDTAAGLSWDLGVLQPGAKVSEQSTLAFGSSAAPPGYSSGCSDTRPWDSGWYAADTTPQWVVNKDESQTFKMTSGGDIGRYVTSGHGGISVSFTLPYEGPTDALGYPTTGNRFTNTNVDVAISAFDVDGNARCPSVSGFRPEKDALKINSYGEDKWVLSGSDQTSATTHISIPADLLHFATKRDGTDAMYNTISIDVGVGSPTDQWGLRVDEMDLTLQAPAATDHPVVLLHGLMGINSDWTNEMKDLQRYFSDLGIPAINPNQEGWQVDSRVPGVGGTVVSLGSVEEDLSRISATVDNFYRDNGYAGMYVVGHSMGGLVGRYMLSKMSCIQVGSTCRPAFDKLVSLGTPHGGIAAIDDICDVGSVTVLADIGVGGSVVIRPFGPACSSQGAIRELSPKWMQSTFISWAPYSGSYYFVQMVGNKDDGCFGGQELYPDTRSDGCVSIDSQTWMSRYGADTAPEFPIDHGAETNPSNVGLALADWLELDWWDLPPNPAKAAPATTSTSQSADSASQRVPSQVKGVELEPGASADITLAFEGASAATVYVTDANYDITASFAGTDLDFSGLPFLTTDLASPIDGVLHVTNNGTQTEDVGVVVSIPTDRKLTVTSSTETTAIGQAVPVDIILSGATADDEVTASLVDANGTSTPITLTKVDTGHWTAQVTPTSGGLNTVVAETTTGATRWAQALIDVAGGGVTHTGTISSSTVDLNGDYLADQLVVTVPVTIAKAGPYQIQARLVDSNGATIATNIDSVTNLVAGDQTATLTFEGSDIYASGKSGPYDVVDVRFLSDPMASDCTTEALVSNLGQTQAYDYHAFQHRQIAIDPTSVSVSTTDGDDNGYFEALSASGQVTVEHGGRYLVAAGLYAQDGTQVAQASKQVDLTDGSNSFTLLFDGRDIWRSGKDGPYTIRNLSVAFAASPSIGDSIADSVTSSSYTVSQFTPSPTSAIDASSIPLVVNSTSLSVPYAATIPNSPGSYVELWQRHEAPSGSWSSWTKVATSTTSPIPVSLDSGAGTYEFATAAVDPTTGMSQPLPAEGQVSVQLATFTSATSASVTALASSVSSGTLSVAYTTSGTGAPPASVELWQRYQAPGSTTWTDWAKVATATASPFNVSLTSGDGRYEFYTIAVDAAGNRQAAPTTADAFTVLDTVAPTSSVSALPSAVNDTSISVPFSAADDANGSGVAGVELWRRYQAPGSTTWTDWAKVATAATSPFNVSLTLGDGPYQFYTIAVDAAGNRETAPAVAKAWMVLDTGTPTSAAGSLPSTTTAASLTIPYTVTATNPAGTQVSVELWQRSQDPITHIWTSWTKVSTVTNGSTLTASLSGDGRYEFFTVAVDAAGNRETKPQTAAAFTVCDRTAPSTAVTALPASTTATTQRIAYSVSDNGGTGVVSLALYGRFSAAGTSSWSSWSVIANPSTTGSSVTVTLGSGDGRYEYYFAATDAAGNVESGGVYDTYTVLDRAAPVTKAVSPAAAVNSTTLSLGYTATEPSNSSGMASVDLYQRFTPSGGTAGSWTKVAMAASSPITVSLNKGDGKYQFYTVGVDTAGNRETKTATAEASTVLDTVGETSKAGSIAALTTTTSVKVPYTATIPDSKGTAVTIELWSRFQAGSAGWSTWSRVTSVANGGTLTAPLTADGRYEFYTIAADAAGNRETKPQTAETFTVRDKNAPVSSASALASPSKSTAQSVAYTATDDGSGIASVELWQRFQAAGSKTWSAWAKIATPTTSPVSVTLGLGDGRYEFYTIAVDVAGHREAAPTTADTFVILDTTPPSSSVITLPATASGGSVSLTYTSTDNTNSSGVASVELWTRYKANDGAAAGTWTKVATSTSASGTFTVPFGSGAGIYDVATVAVDGVGYREATSVKTSIRAISWAPSTVVNADTGSALQDNVAYAMSPDGTLYAVWDDMRNGNSDVYFSQRDPSSGAWSAETRLNTDTTTTSQRTPAIAVDGSGNVYVVWADDRAGSTDTDIYFVKRTGTTWGANTKVSDATSASIQDQPRIAVTPAGMAVAVWVDKRSSQTNIYSARLAAGATTWSANFKVTGNTSAAKAAPDVAMASDGTAWVVWQDARTNAGDIYAASLGPTATAWSTNTRVDDDTVTTGVDRSPRIGIASNGNLLVAWLDGRTAAGQVRVRQRTGTTWSASVQVSDATAVVGTRLALATKSDGGVILAWDDTRATTSAIWGAQCETGSTSVTRCAVPELWSDQSGAAYRPTLVSSGSNVVLGWRDDTTGGGDIRFRVRTPS